MGQMHFHIPNASSFDERIWETAYICGIEGVPWKCRSTLKGDRLTLERSLNESGRVFFNWPTADYGLLNLPTANLREQDRPYLLPLELARGTIFRIRSRAFDWQRIGLKIPKSYFEEMEQSLKHFLDAIQAQSDPGRSAFCANQSIRHAVSSTRVLCRSFISQSLQARHQQEEKLSTLLGASIPLHDKWQSRATAVRPAINTVQLAMHWNKLETDSGQPAYERIDQQVQWATDQEIRVMAGPLISLQPHAIPNWLYLVDDFESLQNAATSFVARTVERYRGRVHLWNAATGLNSPNSLGLTDEEVLRLAVSVIETIRRIDDRTPVLFSVDMPWAEYLSGDENAISPFHFADALVRAELGISGIGLELNCGFWPYGSMPKDLIEISDLIDRWSILGMPLIGMIAAPHSLAPDPNASSKIQLVSNWKFAPEQFGSEADYCRKLPPHGLEIFQMLLAKPNIYGMFWSNCDDSEPHSFPNSGVFDHQGVPRNLLHALKQLRELHVQ